MVNTNVISCSSEQRFSVTSPFRSFFLGGFESAYHVNIYGRRVDMIASTGHDAHVRHDYAQAREIGIFTVRDAVRWHLVDKANRYDLSSFSPMLDAALREDIQVIWTLCHYGWPDDLDVFSSRFVDRFVRYSRFMTKVLVDKGVEAPMFIPFNEISYLCHAICTEGDIYPYAIGQDWELKRQIVRATIEASDAIKSIAPKARLVHVDPIIHVVPPVNRPDLLEEAEARKQGQYEAAEMIAGRKAPELGGKEGFLDLVGVNFYHANQWEHPGDKTIFWHHTPRDPRWRPLHQLLQEAQRAYRRPLFIAETSHVGVGRPAWTRETLREVRLAQTQGVHLYGVCLYPIVDRHCWVDHSHWHNSGIWDVDPKRGYARTLSMDYFNAFQEMRDRYPWTDVAARQENVGNDHNWADDMVPKSVDKALETDKEAAEATRAFSIADDM
jgi:beta-glucosidase/6-phospho-beta-glucosidase/beta-galactosidase